MEVKLSKNVKSVTLDAETLARDMEEMYRLRAKDESVDKLLKMREALDAEQAKACATRLQTMLRHRPGFADTYVNIDASRLGLVTREAPDIRDIGKSALWRMVARRQNGPFHTTYHIRARTGHGPAVAARKAKCASVALRIVAGG